MTMTPLAPLIMPGTVITQEFRTPKAVQRGIAAGNLAGAAALAFVGAILLPPAARHGVTREFAAPRLRRDAGAAGCFPRAPSSPAQRGT